MNSLKITTRNLDLIPDIDKLKKICQSISVIETILEGEYYWFDSTWDEESEVFGMSNGEGDYFHILFNKYGAIILGLELESEMSPFRKKAPEVWPGLTDSVPEEFNYALHEPAFDAEEAITYCIWRKYNDKSWQIGDIIFPSTTIDPDGSGRLWLLNGDQEEILEFMKANNGIFDYDKDYGDDSPYIELEDINYIFDHKPLTDDFVSKINPRISLAQIRNELIKIGYPIG
jgi:hypothetical protein